MNERFKRVVEAIVTAEDEVCGELEEAIVALTQKTLDDGVAAAWGEYPGVVKHLEDCPKCREMAVDLLRILWLDFLGLLEEPPKYPEFNFSFLEQKG